MVTHIRATKLIINDMLNNLGGEVLECPDCEVESEHLLFYVACRRYRGSTKKVMLRWERYVMPPTFLQGSSTQHAVGDWQYDAAAHEWYRFQIFVTSSGLALNEKSTLGIRVGVKERYFGNDALVRVWLFDDLSEEERYTEEDHRQGYRFGYLPPESELTKHYQAQGVTLASFDLTDADLVWLDKFAAYFAPTASDGEESLLRLGNVSKTLLACYMGETWKERHTWAGLVDAKRGKSFGRFGPVHFMANEKHLLRVITLAEILYNLQGVPGIQERVRLLRTEDIESALGEMEGAQLLYASGRDIAFVNPPHGTAAKKGENYDIDVPLSDGTLIACEVKTKLEVTQFGGDTVLNTLKKASRQVPGDRPAVVVLKAPDIWFDQVDAKEMLDEVAVSFFRQCRGVSAVFYHWHLWTKVDNHSRQHFKYHACINDAAQYTHPELKELIRPPLSRYRRLSEILGVPHLRFNHLE